MEVPSKGEIAAAATILAARDRGELEAMLDQLHPEVAGPLLVIVRAAREIANRFSNTRVVFIDYPSGFGPGSPLFAEEIGLFAGSDDRQLKTKFFSAFKRLYPDAENWTVGVLAQHPEYLGDLDGFRDGLVEFMRNLLAVQGFQPDQFLCLKKPQKMRKGLP